MRILKSFYCLLLLPLVACSDNASAVPEVYVDKDFTKLYMPDRGGVTGADGTISILLDDGSSVFMTGDCFVGPVVDGKRDKTQTTMVNNSLIHIGPDYKYLGSYFGGNLLAPENLCTPLEAATSDKAFWYWPGHGFQRGRKLHTFWSKFYQGGQGQWGFRYRGMDYVVFDMDKNYRVESIEEIYDLNAPVHWGHCVLKLDDWCYVYGTRSGVEVEPAELCVSRARFDSKAGKLGAYEYFDGEGWTSDVTKAAACEGLDVSVSEQFSVFKHGEKYVLLTQRRAQKAGDIYTYISDTPFGPWSNKKHHYTTTEQDERATIFTYNAMAHPQFINDKGELLICYNINSYDLDEPFREAWTYRPVFLRVPMRLILE